MATKNEITNIRVYKKKWNINIGLIIFGFIFLYLVGTVLMYLTTKHVTSYEVREGSILKDNTYTGVALRMETVVNAETDGYINYYANEGDKVAAGSNVYTLSTDKVDTTAETITESTALSEDEQQSVLFKIQQFNEAFNEEDFSDIYNLKTDIDTVLSNNTKQGKIQQLDALITNGDTNNPTSIYRAQEDGILSYSIDGLETITPDTLTPDMIYKTNYHKIELRNNEKIKTENPVYKLISSEDWSVVIPLTPKTAKMLKDTSYIKVRMKKDNKSISAKLTIFKNEDLYLGKLDFHNSMIRYANERYLDLELIFEDKSGLKIPKSSIVKKSFYTVPEEYLTQGGNGNDTGVLKQTKNKKGKVITEFLSTPVYYRKEGYVYLDPNDFEKNDCLVKPKSTDIYPLEKEKKLKGVYNINKGYAVFKQISILCESEEYYIVEEGNSYGLSNYDHIALKGKDVKENAVVF
ncbi:MAG: HlyD family efflux transporter periplasmic adaptor subunit [Lachnospiraceae bacterium]